MHSLLIVGLVLLVRVKNRRIIKRTRPTQNAGAATLQDQQYKFRLYPNVKFVV